VILSLLYKVALNLLSMPSVLLRGEDAKNAELLVLRHENAVLRLHLPRMSSMQLRALFSAAAG
jgi:hypothetical protein